MDLPEGADLAAYRRIAGGVIEQLEGSLLALDVIVHAVDLGKAAPPDGVQDLEAALENITDRVVNGLGPAAEASPPPPVNRGSGSALLPLEDGAGADASGRSSRSGEVGGALARVPPGRPAESARTCRIPPTVYTRAPMQDERVSSRPAGSESPRYRPWSRTGAARYSRPTYPSKPFCHSTAARSVGCSKCRSATSCRASDPRARTGFERRSSGRRSEGPPARR